ncbi:hypothetical protein X757_20255 [Mesorhizobium sp. LSHC414A00]|nr:hypothetical protein X757_20255 [Mesorhizobium sp. LSHC414A00]
MPSSMTWPVYSPAIGRYSLPTSLVPRPALCSMAAKACSM